MIFGGVPSYIAQHACVKVVHRHARDVATCTPATPSPYITHTRWPGAEEREVHVPARMLKLQGYSIGRDVQRLELVPGTVFF